MSPGLSPVPARVLGKVRRKEAPATVPGVDTAWNALRASPSPAAHFVTQAPAEFCQEPVDRLLASTSITPCDTHYQFTRAPRITALAVESALHVQGVADRSRPLPGRSAAIRLPDLAQGDTHLKRPQIIHLADTALIDRGGGVTTNRLVTSELGAQAFVSGITTFAPNSKLALHTHNVDESVTVLEGEAWCDLDGESYRLKPWDTTFVPAGTPHRFVNDTGQTMRILWVYGGVDVSRTILEPDEARERRAAAEKPDRR